MSTRRRYNGGPRLVFGVDGGAVPPARRGFPNGTFIAVPCPDCPALAKQKCRSNTSGKEKAEVHVARRRIAIRKYRADQEASSDSVG